ncbi:uncharacterized protein EI90DRAFT_3137367 [Cantharellus anzutake]|uniref:uncharacterized protein n=1 Tax=Cantharellus anzutake TaxID=1750568 RepID=UPI0019046C19|nr:uncharacterized protein EI90DRAFT_3137367 [Cantharellus anzutake]KAF8312556.1 hypothetical protein EI90DRAFT_3137367 [Cantharellus anzutake]
MSYKSGYIESSNGPRRENSRSRVEDSRHVYHPIESVPYGSSSLRSPPSTRHTMSHHDHGDREYFEAHFPVMPARSLCECQVAAHPPSVPSFVSHHVSLPTVRSLWERQVTEGPTSQPSSHAYDINPLPVRSHCERQVPDGIYTKFSPISQVATSHTVRSIEERQVPVADPSILASPTTYHQSLNSSLHHQS